MKKKHLFVVVLALVAMLTLNSCTTDENFEELTIETVQTEEGDTEGGDGSEGGGGNPPPAVNP